MAGMTPDQIAAEWANGLASKTAKIQAGVQAVSVSPGAAAARQKTVWLQNLQASADKWAQRVSQLSTADWQTAMINKGIPRIATGAQAAQPKFAAFMTRLLPHIQSGRSALPARGNLQTNIQRMVQFTNHMASFGGRRPGS